MVELVTSLAEQKRLRGGNLKFLLKKIFKRDLPPEILTRKKQGFAVPLDRVLETGLLKGLVAKIKKGDTSLRLWQYINLESWLSYSASEIEVFSPYVFQLWKLVVLEKWLQKYGF